LTVTGGNGAVIALVGSTTSAWTATPTSATIDYALVTYSTTNLATCATHSTSGGNNNVNWSFSVGVSCVGANATPATPSLTSPSDTATNQSLTPTLTTTTTDSNSDHLRYKIELCQNALMTTSCQTFNQMTTQLGWSGQDTDSGFSYASGTAGSYTLQTSLAINTTYYWRSYATDPAGSNVFSSTQGAPYSFTTNSQITQTHYRVRNDDGIEGGENSISYQLGDGKGTASETDDTYVDADSPTVNNGTDVTMLSDGLSPHSHPLLKFPNIFGTSPNQIPLGSTIYSASIEVYVTNGSGSPVTVYELTEGWNENEATWNESSTGVSWVNAGADGTGSHATVAEGEFPPSSSGTKISVEVTSSLQNWSDGSTNNGWVFIETSTNGMDVSSSDDTTQGNRPKLTVVYSNGGLSSTSLIASADTYLNSASTTTNYGTSDPLLAEGSPQSSALMKWDFSSIGTGTHVNSVSMKLNIVGATFDTYNLYQVKRNWTENGATWNTYDGTNNWTTAGANDTTNDISATVLGSADAEATGSYTFTLNAAGISVVEGWVNGTTPNYGMLFMNDAGALDGVDFSYKENATSDNSPTQIIEYATTPSATFAANEDTKLTGATVGTNYRLRFEIANNNPSEVINSYQLQVAQHTICSSGTYTSVPTDTSGHWQIGASTYVEDGLHTANISPGLTDSLTTFVPGNQKDTGNITNDITLSTDEFTEIEFSVKATTNAAKQYQLLF
jgi:hypothetical protein